MLLFSLLLLILPSWKLNFNPVMSYVIGCCIRQRMGSVIGKRLEIKNKILVTWRTVQANSTRSYDFWIAANCLYDWKKNEGSSFLARRERHYGIKPVDDDLIFLKIKSHGIFFIPVTAWKCIGLYMFSLKVSTIKLNFFVLVSASLSCLFS